MRMLHALMGRALSINIPPGGIIIDLFPVARFSLGKPGYSKCILTFDN